MLSRFEYSIESGHLTEVAQVVYRNDEGVILVLDKGGEPPHGFTEFTGDLNEEPPTAEE